MSKMEKFDIGEVAVNAYSQEVEIIDITGDEVVFRWIYQDSVDVLNVDDFDKFFRKI